MYCISNNVDIFLSTGSYFENEVKTKKLTSVAGDVTNYNALDESVAKVVHQ